MEGLGDEFFAPTGAVNVSGVDEIDAEFDCTAQETDGVIRLVGNMQRPKAEAPYRKLAAQQKL